MARVRGRRNFKKWAASNRAGLLAITITMIYTTIMLLIVLIFGNDVKSPDSYETSKESVTIEQQSTSVNQGE